MEIPGEADEQGLPVPALSDTLVPRKMLCTQLLPSLLCPALTEVPLESELCSLL